MDWHDYDLLRASGAATVHGYYGGGGSAAGGGYHDEVGESDKWRHCNNITPLAEGHWKICRPRAKRYVARGPHDAARGP